MTDSKNSDQLEIEKERQKTIRYGMYMVVVLVLFIGAYMVFTDKDVKKLDLNIEKGTVVLEKYDMQKPLTEQGKTETSTYKKDGETIEYTTGSVPQQVIQSIEKENIDINNNGFTGNNFINQKFNFLFYCPSPQNWNVQYNEAALTDPINNSLYTFTNAKDPRFKVETIIGTNNYNLTLEQFVNTLATSSAYAGIQMSDIQYQNGNTAFMAYDNPNMGNSYIVKIIAKDNFFYIFGCSYPMDAGNDKKVNTLKQMVSTFSIIQA